MDSAAETAAPPNQPDGTDENRGPRAPADEGGSLLDCNICLDTATDPVVTYCGHLFCWPCIFQWIRNHNERPCPVCKSAVTKERCIPLYGRGQKQRVDPREKELPQRPAGQRQEPTRSAGYNPFGGPMQFDNMTFSAGFGFFPSLFGLQFQTFPPPQQHGAPVPRDPQEEMLSRALMAMAMFIMFCLLFL